MKNIIVFGICATISAYVHDWAIRHNLVQVVKEERWNPQTNRWEIIEMYPERFNPDQNKDSSQKPHNRIDPSAKD